MSIIIVGVGPAEFDGKLPEFLVAWKQKPPATKLYKLKSVIRAYYLADVNVHKPGFQCPQFMELKLFPSVLSLSAMVELDGDEVRISSRGRYAERDIVQVLFTLFNIKTASPWSLVFWTL